MVRQQASSDEQVDQMFREVERSHQVPSNVSTFDATDTVLCALAMRLPRADAEDLADVVPPSLRRMISRCVIHENDLPEISFDQRGFLNLIATRLSISVEAAERVCRAVFSAVQTLMPEDEIWDVRNRLPRDLDALWYPFTQSGRAAFEEPVPEAANVLRAPRPLEEPTESVLRELEQSGVLPKGTAPAAAMRAVLCTLSMEMTGAEARMFAELAPRTMRRLLDRCVAHRGERPQSFDQAAFLDQVAEHLDIEPREAEQIARTVFAALRGRMPADEVQRIDNRLPRSVRKLWRPSRD
ncbi:MAG: DUF2267 domain-containing protein [Kofleriaceae bacterium]|nr:DUF2267 domain-containing protein [Kofleriaceae bacterium]